MLRAGVDGGVSSSERSLSDPTFKAAQTVAITTAAARAATPQRKMRIPAPYKKHACREWVAMQIFPKAVPVGGGLGDCSAHIQKSAERKTTEPSASRAPSAILPRTVE